MVSIALTTPPIQTFLKRAIPYVQKNRNPDPILYPNRSLVIEPLIRKISYLGSAAWSFIICMPSLLYTLGALLTAPVRGTEPLKKHLFTFLRQSELLLGYLAGVVSENALDFCRIDATLHLRYYNREISPDSLALMESRECYLGAFANPSTRSLQPQFPPFHHLRRIEPPKCRANMTREEREETAAGDVL